MILKSMCFGSCDWLYNEENGQWLMILDNADDIDAFYPRRKQHQGTAVTSIATTTARILLAAE